MRESVGWMGCGDTAAEDNRVARERRERESVRERKGWTVAYGMSERE